MNLKKILKRIIILFKAKYTFAKINKAKIVIYDEVGSSVFSDLLFNKKYFILNTRFEKINIIIFLQSLIKFGFKWKPINYIELFLEYLKPKYLITFIDNDKNFWELKNKFNNTKFYFIQNGYRDSFNDVFRLKKNICKKYRVDKMLVFSDHIGLEYKKFINGETIVTGSYYNNKFKLFKKLNKNILYISSWDTKDNLMNNDKYLKFHKVDLLSFQLVSEFAEKYKFKLKVLGRKLINYNEEEQFFRNINKNFIFIKRNINRKYSYKELDESKIVIAVDSTLAYESFSRGNKTFFISCRNNFAGGHGYEFGWPSKNDTHGYFWSNKFNKEVIFKSLVRLINLDKKNFNKKLKPFKNKFIYFDEKNIKTKNFFKNSIK